MNEETKVITVPEELRHKIEVLELRVGKTQAELGLAQLSVTAAQTALANYKKDVDAINERIAVEITDRGAWEIVQQNNETGEYTLKLSTVGKERRKEKAATAAEQPNGASINANPAPEA